MATIPNLSARVLLWTLTVVVSAPMMCWTGYELYRNRNAQWLLKRRRGLVTTLYIFVAYSVLIVLPLRGLKDIKEDAHAILSYVELFVHVSWIVLLTLMCMLYVERAYLLRYDHLYGAVLASSKWKILLDPSFEHTNWYLKNRQRYGSHRWLAKFVIVPLMAVFCAVYFTTFYVAADQAEWLTSAYFVAGCVMSLCVVAAMWRRFPKINDAFKIREELRLILIVWCVCFPIINTCILIFFLTMHSSLASLYMAALLAVFFDINAYLSIIYPSRAVMNKSGKEKRKVSNKKNLTFWSQVVENKDGYEAFANFLESEFSVENILFVTEYIQFKHALMDNEQISQQMQQLELDFDMSIPDTIPLSQIANEFDASQDMKQSFYSCARKLYLKYIDSSQALMEVNISSATRQQLMYAFRSQQQLSLEQILPLLEIAVKEISGLMNDSYTRFRQKTVFYELNEQIAGVLSTSAT